MYFLKRSALSLALLFVGVSAPLRASVSITGDAANGWELSGDAIRVGITAAGDVRGISRLGAGGKSVWRVNLPRAGFWGLHLGGASYSVDNARLLSAARIEDARGVGVKFAYALDPAGIRVDLTYRVDRTEGDRLRVGYALSHHESKPARLRFNIACIGNLDASPEAWFVLPYRSGKLYRTDSFRKYGEEPAPGHLWMQWTGYYDGKGNGLLTYPEDVTGFLKFAQYGPGNGFRMGWSESVVLTPGQDYAVPYEYVVRPLAAPDTFNDLAAAYAEFGRAQAWVHPTLAEKIRARPELGRVIREGVVKLVGFGALDIEENGRRVFKPREEKEKLAAPHHTFDRALRDARALEALYDIKPAYRYDGWWGRFDAEYPFVFPVSQRLGGDEKFAWFQQENRKDGRYVMYHFNPVQYDWENKAFNMDHMVMMRDGEAQRPDVWSGNKLYLVSPKFAVPDDLATLDHLRDVTEGAGGVFWDVIGAMSPYNDFNPHAGYPAWGRDYFYQGVLKLFASLRAAAPGMVYGTEDGQEQMLPYFDWAPNYRSFGDGKAVSWAPLAELVYGDCFANVVGIDGNNRTYNDATRAVRALYGAAMGQDARGAWVDTYTPVIQQIFELNHVFAPAATTRMQRHEINPAGWRASVWPDQVVVANTAAGGVLANVRVPSPLGEVVVEGLRPNGFAVVTRDGGWAAWGAQKISVDGRVIVSVSNPDSILIRNERGLTVTSYDFRNRDRGSEPSPDGCDLPDWRVSGAGLPAGWARQLTTWPGKAAVAVKAADRSFLLAAPGEDRVDRTFQP